MPAIVMKVTKSEKHPNADALRIYEMSHESTIQVVANLTNVYEVGENAIVVTDGSVLKTGEIIKISNVRGAKSFGMALGKTDHPVGTDLTEEYCVISSNPRFIPWTEIESLFNVRKNLSSTNTLRNIKYFAKVKLDGTNAGIQILPSGEVVCQSRERIITPDNDNYGFARWVQSQNSYFSALKETNPIVIFGEWCGQGIQSSCSITQIGRKVFCVFAIQRGSYLDTNPKSIREKLPENNDVFVVPQCFDIIELDYVDKYVLEKQIEVINGWVAEVEKCDPFVAETFKVEGLGEGIVLYPIITETLITDRNDYSELVFKAKGEKHKVVKTKKAVQVDAEVVKSTADFVNLFVTLPRLEQIAGKVGSFDSKLTGQFLKLFCQDVEKESKVELEASGLEWKQAASAVSTAARNWWLEQAKKIV